MDIKIDQEIKQFIEETDVLNTDLYNGIKEEVTCIICQGLLNHPVVCATCEIPFCKMCIDKWNKNNQNTTCPTRCSNKLILKPIGRTLKNLLDKIIVKCQYGCKVSLSNYPSHIVPCHEKNKIVNCWCCNGRTNIYNIKASEWEYNTLIMNVSNYESTIINLEKANLNQAKNIKRLQNKIKSLTNEKERIKSKNKKQYKDNENLDTKKEIFLNLKIENEKKDRHLQSFCDSYLNKMIITTKRSLYGENDSVDQLQNVCENYIGNLFTKFKKK